LREPWCHRSASVQGAFNHGNPLSIARPLIAVVDDEEPVRRALKRLLRSAGFDVETFTSGAQFLDSLPRQRPACVVLDLHMPHVNGFEVQERLTRAQDPLPVLVITGQDTEESRQRALDGGAVAYLRKPIDDESLLAALADAIAGQRGDTILD
jgi:FixJ family two-component response regulator